MQVLRRAPFKALEAGEAMNVPLIIGMNKDDGTEFMDGCPNDVGYWGYPACNISSRVYNHMEKVFAKYARANSTGLRGFTDQLYKTWIEANFGAHNLDKLLKVYPGPHMPQGLMPKDVPRFSTNYWAAETLLGDYIMYCTGRRAARISHDRNRSPSQRVFQYYFIHTPNEAPFSDPRKGGYGYGDSITDGWRACHGCEIPFVFLRDDSDDYGINGTAEIELGRAMSTYWSNFAWNSDPNNSTGRHHPEVLAQPPRWKGYSHKTDDTVILDIRGGIHPEGDRAKGIYVGRHPRSTNCDNFWDSFYTAQGWFSH